jgi:polysaccharide export outer membrane protein
MAGDIGMFGDRGRIKIIRETDNGTIVKSFDIRSEDILHSEFYYIEPNDVIYIQTLDEQIFSISNFPTLLSTTISSISFAAFLFQLFYPAAAN